MIYRKSKLSNALLHEKINNTKIITNEPNNSSINEKKCYAKISDIFKCIFEDLFPSIISNKSKESFIDEINDKSMNIIHNNFSDNDLQNSLINSIISKVKDEIKDKISKIHSFLEKSLEDIDKKDKDKCNITHFRKHCIKSENIAYHLCDNGKLGKFIKIESEFHDNENNNYTICENCHYCYPSNCIKMYCNFCKKSYYSSILSDKDNMNILPSTWDTYHCGIRKKEMMKCLKCKEILYLDLSSNRLICLNKNCNFSSKPEHIIWGCHLCGAEFKSGAKIYNPLEFIILNKVINRALLYKIKAIPPFLPCCKGKIDEKTIFYHNKKCDGKLYKFNLDGKNIVVCEKCQVLNKFNYFSWFCPLCSQNFTLNNENKMKLKKHNHSNSSLNIQTKYNYELLKNKKILVNNNNNIRTQIVKTQIDNLSSTNKNLFGFGFIKKEIQATEYAKSKSKEKRDKIKNKSFDKTNIITNDIDNDRNSKSIDNNKDYRKHLRKRRTLQDILNSRKDTPSFGKRRKNENSEKSGDLTGRINYKNKLLNNSIDNGLTKEEKKEDNNLNIYKKRIENCKINNRLDDIKKVNVNKYINVISKRNSKEIDNNEKNTKYKNYYNINNINNINIITSIGIEKTKKLDKSNSIAQKNNLSTSQNVINANENNNIIRKSINKLVPKRYLKENKLSSMEKINPINKYIENNTEQNSNLNKTAENFYKKNISSVNVEPFNNEIIANRAYYRQNKVGEYCNKRANIKSNNILEKKKEESSRNDEQKINKFVNKFIWKRKKLDDYINEKENLDTKKHEKDSDIIKNEPEIEKKNISDDIISNDKIIDLSKHCTIPLFDDKDYNYIKLIGEGSYGKIYLVEDRITREEYALKKVICADYKELLKFKKEFELINSLQNPNILHIYKLQIKSLDLTTSCLYVLMERAQTDWNVEIKRRKLAKKFYKENEIISILKQLSQGLFFLQKNKIAHRDIKPQNILIFPNNVYKIADMGEAKEINKNRMQMATLRGSELFMSPLLYEGLKYNKKNIRHNPYKSDMFSLGLCFLYAICLNLKILEYIREMKSMNSIKNILAKFLDKNKYSDKLIEIIYKMIDLEEINRFDFEELEKELTNF